MTAFGRLLWVLGILALVSRAPWATVLADPPDAAAPAELAVKLPAAKDALVNSLDRQWTPARAILASRCRPLADIDPRSMGGVVHDFATDYELEHLRSPAQNPSPPR